MPEINPQELKVAENRRRFTEIYRSTVTREGADRLFAYLESTDFFSAPASTRYHGNYEGGLCQHSLNVYDCLCDILARPRMQEVYGIRYSDESIAIAALLHDLCKVNVYRVSTRNVKDPVTGQWKPMPYYEFDDNLPYGHGEKSVYVISGFMRQTREEAFAIRYHMGFSNEDDARNVGRAFELFPLALALSIADTEATYFMETKKEPK